MVFGDALTTSSEFNRGMGTKLMPDGFPPRAEKSRAPKMFSRFFAISSGSSTFSRKSFIPAARNTSESNSSTRRAVFSRFAIVSITRRMFARPTSTASPPGVRNGRITFAISATEMYCSGKARMVTWLAGPRGAPSTDRVGSRGSVFASDMGTMWYVSPSLIAVAPLTFRMENRRSSAASFLNIPCVCTFTTPRTRGSMR